MKSITSALIALATSSTAMATSVITFNATVEQVQIHYPGTVPETERNFPLHIGDSFSFRVLLDLDRPGGRSIQASEDLTGTAPLYHAPNYPSPSPQMKYVPYSAGQNVYYSELLDYVDFGPFTADPYYVTSMVGAYSSGNQVLLINRPFTLEDNTHSIRDWINGIGDIRFVMEMQEQHTVPFYVSGRVDISSVSSVPEPSSFMLFLIGTFALCIPFSRFRPA